MREDYAAPYWDCPRRRCGRCDGATRWPTFGIRLAAHAGMPPTRTVRGPLSLAFAALETLISDQDSAYIDDRYTVRRTIFVPADSVLPLDFDLPKDQQKALYDCGLPAAAFPGHLELPRLPEGLPR
jgi:NTE family protein